MATIWTTKIDTIKYGTLEHAYQASRCILPLEKINSVFVIPFTKNCELFSVINQRGIGLPGGTVKNTDDHIFETGKRELKEEIGIELKPETIKVVRNVINIADNNPFPKPSMTIITGIIDKIEDDSDFVPQGSIGRKKYDNETAFINDFTDGHISSTLRLIAEAKQQLFGTPIPSRYSLKSLDLK